MSDTENQAANANDTNSTAKKPDGSPDQITLEKEDSKFLRLFFVGVYLCAVTGMGMTLSIYYLFLWDSKMPEIPKITRRH